MGDVEGWLIATLSDYERLSVGDDPFSLSGDHVEERFDEERSSY